MAKPNPPFMSGVPEFLILRLLWRQEMYGYELVRTIRQASQESINLAEGVVYPVLHALEQQGALRSKEKSVNGRRRVYYRLTAKGNRRLDDLARRWDQVSAGVSSVLGEAHA